MIFIVCIMHYLLQAVETCVTCLCRYKTGRSDPYFRESLSLQFCHKLDESFMLQVTSGLAQQQFITRCSVL